MVAEGVIEEEELTLGEDDEPGLFDAFVLSSDVDEVADELEDKAGEADALALDQGLEPIEELQLRVFNGLEVLETFVSPLINCDTEDVTVALPEESDD